MEKEAASSQLGLREALPQLLRQMPRRHICALRRAALRHRAAVLWQPPHGRAYDFLMASLCRRALALRARRAPRAPLPPWAACARLTAAELLEDVTF